jgi:negative regulator of sigma E activity
VRSRIFRAREPFRPGSNRCSTTSRASVGKQNQVNEMNQTMTVREQVSALADGHLQGDEFAQAIDKVCGDEEYRAAWQAYHVVGDVLRSGSTTACSDGNAFLARFQQRLAAEPVAIRPVAAVPEAQVVPLQRRADAANEPVFRWKLVAGAASLVAVAAISWSWGRQRCRQRPGRRPARAATTSVGPGARIGRAQRRAAGLDAHAHARDRGQRQAAGDAARSAPGPVARGASAGRWGLADAFRFSAQRHLRRTHALSARHRLLPCQ